MIVGLHLGAPGVPLLLSARVDLPPDLRVRERAARGVILATSGKVEVAVDSHLVARGEALYPMM